MFSYLTDANDGFYSIICNELNSLMIKGGVGVGAVDERPQQHLTTEFTLLSHKYKLSLPFVTHQAEKIS